MTWRIEQADCLAPFMAIEAATVAAVVCDPPYCSGGFREADKRSSKGLITADGLARHGWFGSDNMGTAGLVWLLRCVAVEAYRALVDGGHLLVFCDWRMIPVLQPALESSGLKWQQLVVWDKQSAGLGGGFRSQHECVLHFCKGTAEYSALDTGNVIRCRRTSNDREHPTEKPVDLMRALLRVVAPPGGLIVDPFAGSGTTGVAALMQGMRFIGFEREADFCDIARGRLAAAASAVLGTVSVAGRASQTELALEAHGASE